MFQGIDHVEHYVGNGFMSAYFFTHALGFRPLAQAGLETGLRDRQSYVVGQGSIRLVFTNALAPDGPVAEHARVHGDGIRDVALAVDDAGRAFERCVAAGAEPIEPPREIGDERGRVRRAAVRTFGDTVHSLIERGSYSGAFLPGYRPWEPPHAPRDGRLTAIDHVACCVEEGSLARWMSFYERAFGFSEAHHEDIVTDRSAMNSRVVQSDNGLIKLPLMEPAHGRSRSQIEEYLDYHHGPGAQHLALQSSDIAATVRTLRSGGVDSLSTPAPYYESLLDRVGAIDEDLGELRDLNVLVDRDRWGYLLQVFTKPVTGRPTGFLEVVQRKGARSFGGGNVRALFEAVEREQAARGNL
ncbi:MAG TPA: 4-hydroxyphenylpyruvate dioxygenase [Candidatus Polarisedimenticolia bacterium]|nr:4-hydroxyphenylpyruvate dioxygenase [Candidatus Polarisedimenticolia bacterium]